MEIYEYWLGTVERLGNTSKKILIDYAGNAKEVYRLHESEVYNILPKKKAEQLIKSRNKNISIEYEQFSKGNISFYSLQHPLYPRRLKEIPDAPFGIYVLGKLPEEKKPSVAVIGARQCSEYGKYMADQCGRALAEAGINVISGMARGIDGISQSAVLNGGGRTYGVLGCGVDICYPSENRRLYEQMKERGGILSEYPPGTQPKAQLFPPRNRIISGLSDIILIIEAREKSGTLITADMALEQGREVYVVPGRVTDGLSEGCNKLIKQGAGIMLSMAEMLAETGMAHKSGLMSDINTIELTKNTKNSSLLWDALDFYPKDVETIAREAKMEYNQTVFGLMKLCLSGNVKQISPGRYLKNK